MTSARIGIASDHGGYELKVYLAGKLREAGYEVIEFGDRQPAPDDDYPILSCRWPAQLPAATWTAVWPSVERRRSRRWPRTRWRGFGLA